MFECVDVNGLITPHFFWLYQSSLALSLVTFWFYHSSLVTRHPSLLLLSGFVYSGASFVLPAIHLLK